MKFERFSGIVTGSHWAFLGLVVVIATRFVWPKVAWVVMLSNVAAVAAFVLWAASGVLILRAVTRRGRVDCPRCGEALDVKHGRGPDSGFFCPHCGWEKRKKHPGKRH